MHRWNDSDSHLFAKLQSRHKLRQYPWREVRVEDEVASIEGANFRSPSAGVGGTGAHARGGPRYARRAADESELRAPNDTSALLGDWSYHGLAFRAVHLLTAYCQSEYKNDDTDDARRDADESSE